jgi:two-component sensor histidine kinase
VNTNKSSLNLTLHILTWIVLALFPFFLSHSESASIDYVRLLRFTWIPLIFYAIIFYSNYFILIEKYLLEKKIIVFIVTNITMILTFTWLHFHVKDLLSFVIEVKPLPPPSLDNPRPPIQYYVYKDFISMIIPIIIAYTVKTNQKWTKAQAEKKEREKDILKSELQHLKFQLQPHFFFNSLNTIYALIEKSPTVAQETVHSLAGLMRYMLYEPENGKVKLNDEIDFLKKYIELMRIRLSDKTKIKIDFAKVNDSYEITPLLFISLVENAFKHGVSATQPSELFFSLVVKDNLICFVVENTNFPKNELDKSGSGIGLVNLTKRLELIYPKHYNFRTSIEGNVFRTLMEINVNQN